MAPAKKNPSKSSETRQIEVVFGGVPGEYLHFTHYSVRADPDFLTIRLWFDDGDDAFPIFSGLIWKRDLKEQVLTLKQYIEKVGGASSFKQSSGNHRVRWEKPPIAFNALDCACRVDSWGEIVIKKFSHKSVVEAAKQDIKVNGTIHGVYVSPGNVHRALIMDLITKAGTSA